eukprot:CAMPEP_0181202512 /NCGR_PEP_ID=MMETSP1096-20121128/18883_1 /TAXON_ID=156174 ORGANISM="Chrysochromulina ericina, Strain CCMP281" /NCGR_SAMPLE_ID=MMETSP1096 /ASSEMBLY_ACC=CAM_ASM_000453 /LENGTH=52 /DNA_ID=CAMNT_0023293033 /DNA_START=83 /DNA_END=241 /DNA_ORIENTATION=+
MKREVAFTMSRRRWGWTVGRARQRHERKDRPETERGERHHTQKFSGLGTQRT